MKQRIIAVRKSGIHGRGVFALRRIRKGREIIEYRGARIPHAQADAESVDNGHTFLFILNEDWVIDAGRRGNAARWINHSCQPNCVAYLIESKSRDRRRDRVVIEARRDIAPGEELTYDYGIVIEEPLTPRLKKLWACACGAPRCRGSMLKPRRKSRPA